MVCSCHIRRGAGARNPVSCNGGLNATRQTQEVNVMGLGYVRVERNVRRMVSQKLESERA